MAWVYIDDQFDEHPKIAALSDRAFRAEVSALCYANRNLTDGLIPRRVAVARGWSRKVAAELVAANLWEMCDKGYMIHDYDHYQRLAAEVITDKQSKQTRRFVGGNLRAANAGRDAGGRFTSNDDNAGPATSSNPATSKPANGPAADQPRSRSRSPQIRSEIDISRARENPDPEGVSERKALTVEQRGVLTYLADEVQRLVYNGTDAPPQGFCEDLIRRGVTKTDVDHAVQASLGKGEKYVRACLEGRVAEREAGRDPDATDSRGDRGAARGGAQPGEARSRGVARDAARFGAPAGLRYGNVPGPTEGDVAVPGERDEDRAGT